MFEFQPDANQALRHAIQLHQAGRRAEAEAEYRKILRENPRHAEVLHLLGILAAEANRREAAVEFMRQAVAVQPNFPQALFNLGILLRDGGNSGEAVAALRQAIGCNPNFPEAHFNLGNALKDVGQTDDAIAAYRQAIALRPSFPEAHNNLGVLLKEQGQLDAAINSFRRALTLNPKYSEALNNLGMSLADKRQPAEAIAAYRQAIVLKPDSAEAHNNLALALAGLGQLDEAIAAGREAIRLMPSYPNAHCQLGNFLKELGMIDEADAAYRQAIALKPTYAEAHSDLVMALHYHPTIEPEEIAEEHRRWNRQHAAPLQRFIQPHGNSREAERRLRIGYVSPDFREHAVAPMVLPLVANHDRGGFEIFCYGQVAEPDGMTERFRRAADQWRSTVGWSDEQMAEEVRKDEIDILVDLAGHTGGNRLLVLARKPAPVQVARQGYPDTTGLETIDYRISDGYADPPGLSDRLHTEKLVRLAPTNWIYQPPEEAVAMAVMPLAEGPITFGCFNNFAKVTEPMLRLWAKILAAAPGSRLLLKAIALSVKSVQERVRGLFEQEGIAGERVEFHGWRSTTREHLAMYNRVAVGLDPFPYHGTTTTCEALWMGVPVVSLAGRTHVSRVGVSLLSNVGVPELVGQSEEEYVRIAVGLAGDRRRLEQLRSSLRERMTASPILDHVGFARQMEAAYRQMWRKWCEGEDRIQNA